MRSVFERFSDLDGLRLAAADYAIAQGQAEAVARNVDGDRPTRIESHVETRAYACEKWLPLWRIIASLDQVAELRARVVMGRRANITRMRLMYGPELSCLSEPMREQVLFALAGLTSFESWDQIRTARAFPWRPGKAFGGPRSTECCRKTRAFALSTLAPNHLNQKPGDLDACLAN